MAAVLYDQQVSTGKPMCFLMHLPPGGLLMGKFIFDETLYGVITLNEQICWHPAVNSCS